MPTVLVPERFRGGIAPSASYPEGMNSPVSVDSRTSVPALSDVIARGGRDEDSVGLTRAALGQLIGDYGNRFGAFAGKFEERAFNFFPDAAYSNTEYALAALK